MVRNVCYIEQANVCRRKPQVFADILFLLFYLDLTQEVASKGLGLVYEHGGGENKEELVSLLVDTLMTGRR